MTSDLFGHPVESLPPGVSPKRGKPYLWVTWLTGLLAGEDSCHLQPWMQSHFRFPERPGRGNFDLEAWKAEHSAMVEREVKVLTESGWKVTVEDQNKFTYNGRAALVGGKPDIIAYFGETVKVIDVKGGKRRASDYQQVLLYLFFLPRVAGIAPHHLFGEVAYRGDSPGVSTVNVQEVNAEWIARMSATVRQIAGDGKPEAVPSGRECAFCKVPDSLCSSRVEAPPEMYGEGDEF